MKRITDSLWRDFVSIVAITVVVIVGGEVLDGNVEPTAGVGYLLLLMLASYAAYQYGRWRLAEKRREVLDDR